MISERPELVPDDDITHRAVRSGDWNDPGTWADEAVPGDGAEVLIEEDVTVTVTREEQARLRAIRVEGTLRFDPSVDTGLNVDTLLTVPGSALRIGTADRPVAPDVEARITFIDTGPIDESEDPMRVGRGLIVRGDLTIHGAPTTSWTTLSAAPSAGDQELSLTESPTNWRAGDRIAVPGVVPNEDQDEVRQVVSVDGSTVRLDSPVEYDHRPPASDLDAYALNLSRNVVFESEERSTIKRRGHVMVMSTATEVRYALFEGLGRTDKSRVFTNPVRGEENLEDGLDPNPSARYAFHYHKTGIEGEPHQAEGLVVDGSPGWGVVNHHAHAEVSDSITYDVLGAGFVAEGGNERGSFERNFALRSEGSGEPMDSRNFVPEGGQYSNLRPSQDATNRVDDLGHAGHGFWLQSPLVETVDNVAAGHRHYAFVYWTRPLLEGPMAESLGPVADRQGTVPNLPLEYVEGQEPLKQAIEAGRDVPGEYAGMNPEKVSSAFVRIKRFEGNEAFASAGGLDVSRNQFKWEHERFGEFSAIEAFTVYGIGPHIDEDGTVRGVSKRGVKKGGNQGIKLRYVSNISIRNCRLLGTDGSGVGVAPHDYLWTAVIENSTIEGWHLGVGTGEHRLTWVRNNVLDNEVDLDWVIGNTGPLVAENNSLDTLRYALSLRDVKAGELFSPRARAGATVNGRPAFFHEQRADYVPIESADELVTATLGGGYGNMADVIDGDPEDVIGLTNRELMDRFGVATAGSLLPDDADDVPYVAGGQLGPADPQQPSTTVWIDPTTGDTGEGFDVVSEIEASNDRCLRVNDTGTASPPESSANVAEVSFDCAAGTYTIFARIWTSAWNGDTVFFRVDGEEWLAAEKLKQPRGFKWFEVEPDGGSPYEIELEEGEHTIEIGCANDGVLIDKVLVAENPVAIGAYGGSTSAAQPTNRVPTASEDSLSVNQGGSGSIDLLANDSDPDGSLDASDVEITEPPSNGALAIDGGVVEYTHDGSTTTSDRFAYTVADDDGATSEATPVIVSIESNDDPTASGDDVTVEPGGSTTIDVLANDDDADGSLAPSTVRITDAPSYGAATTGADGNIEYSHDGRNTDADSFTYTVADDDGATSQATVDITVEPSSDGSESNEESTDGSDEQSDSGSNDGSSGESDDESDSRSDDEESSSGSDEESGGESDETSGSDSENQSSYTDHDLERIQAEDFDTGGQGVAYSDVDSGNKTGVYRDTDVDLGETDDGSGGYNIGWINGGEWWEYTVDVPASGEHALSVRVAGKNATSIDVAVDGSRVATVDVPDTGDWDAWTTVDAGTVDLPAGTQTVRLTANGGDFNLNWFGFERTESEEDQNGKSQDDEEEQTEQPARDTPNDTQSPYTDHDLSRIQAEDFDTGGKGVAYHDTNRGNKTGVYRDTDVDLEETGDSSGAYNVAWIREGEWWEYTVDVPADGEYALTVRVAGKNATSIDVAVDGSPATTVDVPNTGGWQAWTTVDAGTVELPAGTHTIRLTANGKDFNLNWFGLE